MVRLLNQIFKEADDDRLSTLVNRLLTASQRYILDEQSTAASDPKLIELVVQLFQSMQWALRCDSAHIAEGTQGIDMANLIDTLVTKAYAIISSPLKNLAQLEESGETDKENIMFVKQRRTVSKLLTILLRDYPKLLGAA